MILYIGNKRYSSWSMRPWVLMHSLGLEFDEQLVPFDTDNANPAVKRISPTGKVPVLLDDDIAIWDSSSIIEYVAERDHRAWPNCPRARAWARSAVAEMHSGFIALRDECSMNCHLTIRVDEQSEQLSLELDRLDSLWTQGIEFFGGPWLAGDRFSAVDAYFAPVAVRMRGYGLRLSSRVMEYSEQLLSHHSVKAWIDQGIAEEFDDRAHYVDCVRDRTVLADQSPS